MNGKHIVPRQKSEPFKRLRAWRHSHSRLGQAEMMPDGPSIPKETPRQAGRPSLSQLKAELRREYYGARWRQTLRSTVCALVVAAASSVLVAVLVMPVLQIYGSSMDPTLAEGDVVICIKGNSFEQGDLVAFYYGNKILIKRHIAGPGQWVDIDRDGTVYVDGRPLEEPYLEDKALGECDLTLPYQVPDEKIFVLGDHRSTSVDSRSTLVGCVSEEQLVGKIVFRLWPLASFGTVK